MMIKGWKAGEDILVVILKLLKLIKMSDVMRANNEKLLSIFYIKV